MTKIIWVSKCGNFFVAFYFVLWFPRLMHIHLKQDKKPWNLKRKLRQEVLRDSFKTLKPSSAECTPEWRSQGFKAFPPDNVAAKIKLVLKNNPYYACSLNKSGFFCKNINSFFLILLAGNKYSTFSEVKSNELIRLLQKDGRFVIRQSGSHMSMNHPKKKDKSFVLITAVMR